MIKQWYLLALEISSWLVLLDSVQPEHNSYSRKFVISSNLTTQSNTHEHERKDCIYEDDVHKKLEQQRVSKAASFKCYT